MKKLLILIILLFPVSTFALSLPKTHSDIVLIYDLTAGEVLLEKNSEERTNIASLTKIMTTITAIELNEDLSKKVTITQEMLNGIPSDASIAHLTIGTTYTLEDLLYASILPSGADATQSIAVSTSGSIEKFVQEMNELAKKIGVTNTNFVNVTGLDIDNHYSTAKDVMLILKYALGNPTFKEIYCTREYTLSDNQKVESTINMYTKYMDVDVSKIKGSKTGYTSLAGVCMSSLVDIYDHEIIFLTLKAPYVFGNFYNVVDAVNLIEYVEDNYRYEELVSKGTVVKKISVELSTITSYEIVTQNNFLKFLPSDYDPDAIRLEYEGENIIDYNTRPGAVLGKINYYFEDELVGSEEVILDVEIEPDAIKIIKKYRMAIIFVIMVILLLIICISLLRYKSLKKKKRRR